MRRVSRGKGNARNPALFASTENPKALLPWNAPREALGPAAWARGFVERLQKTRADVFADHIPYAAMIPAAVAVLFSLASILAGALMFLFVLRIRNEIIKLNQNIVALKTEIESLGGAVLKQLSAINRAEHCARPPAPGSEA